MNRALDSENSHDFQIFISQSFEFSVMELDEVRSIILDEIFSRFRHVFFKINDWDNFGF